MTADLYIRVSTDEQAEKGYSQRDQEDRLKKYCESNQIKIRRVIFEDHSAKSFNRPQWNNFLMDLKKRKGILDFVLFTKWDRFSRNAGDAYQMINTLRKLGVEPQAIEQPLDLTVPENKLMLAFYLAAPEVENDRRALNVLMGMRKARKEGRYMGLAPVGYLNKITEDGKKYIAPKEPEASIIKWVFEKIAEGQLNVEQIMKLAFKKGIKCCRANFYNLVRNPVYCGRILISCYKEEASRHAQGLHQQIISEALFYDVQDYLNGKKKTYRTKVGSLEILQLRGYLICPKCSKLLTGSASKGRNGRYYYYHCTSSCGARFKAENANDLFSKEIKKLVPKLGMVEVYKVILQQEFKAKTKMQREDVKQVRDALDKANNELSNARKLLLTSEIEPSDYRSIKAEYEMKITTLESKLMELSKESNNIEPLLNKAVASLSSLDKLYENASTETKREIIGSIYPEKLTFDGFQYRTARLNEAVRLIYSMGKGFRENETEQTEAIFDLSSEVTWIGFEPMTPSLEG
ncbi:MAG: recombinase family protein [Ferruginibacter sp.]|nr:recombinase family protein [Ferruginibacter sp.]